MKLLESDGQKIEVLDRAASSRSTPSLGDGESEIAGGIYCPTDETGDPAKFTRALAANVVARGGQIRTGVTIPGDRNLRRRGRAASPPTRGASIGDAYVLALGSESPLLARKIGLDLPIYPIKGYSLTIPIGNRPHPADDRLDRRAQSGRDLAIRRPHPRHRDGGIRRLRHQPQADRFRLHEAGHARSSIPKARDYDRAEMWAGLRPMTPTNLPLFGRRKYRNLYLNTGHGHIGWTMSHGSARITADLIAGRTPEIPMEGLMD